MSGMIKCYCPKCKGELNNYVRKETAKQIKMNCDDCEISFYVTIKDFKEREINR